MCHAICKTILRLQNLNFEIARAEFRSALSSRWLLLLTLNFFPGRYCSLDLTNLREWPEDNPKTP